MGHVRIRRMNTRMYKRMLDAEKNGCACVSLNILLAFFHFAIGMIAGCRDSFLLVRRENYGIKKV